MWALRRASSQLSLGSRSRGLTSRTAQNFLWETEIAKCCSETYKAVLIEPREKLLDGLPPCTRSYSTSSGFLKLHREDRTFSSQAGDVDHNLEDGSSEDENDDDLRPGSEGEGIANETETAIQEKKTSSGTPSALFDAIIHALPSEVDNVLDKWVEEGNEVTQLEVSISLSRLLRRQLHLKAFLLSKWLELRKHLELNEKSYATRVNLIAKLHGPYKAERYIKEIPEQFRTETVYSALLACYSSAADVKKSEELFNKMKSLGSPITCSSCNHLLRLYKRTNRKKIGDVLQLMEKKNIKPSLLTYKILIDFKGQANDITGMEQIVETMKADGFKPSIKIQASVARYYVANGLKEKAESVLKEMEGGDIENCSWIYPDLVLIYASLGKEDEVERIWKSFESDPPVLLCTAIIEAWGQLNKIENAELAFNKYMENAKNPSSKLFTSLLKVYTNHKMMDKGKDLMKRMLESGCWMGPTTWDALVKLCLAAGEVEKADTILAKATEQKRRRPLYSSFFAIMVEYAERGDIHNTEKIFQMMKMARCVMLRGAYKVLLQAYVNAKAPAHGFKDRMKADNVFPDVTMVRQLVQMDGTQKSAVDELLE